ncbi:hypothetical protein LOZ65_005645 [Ophidiomyces ophidiicola]|nr:hypothetical protein LOZ65_005645 [Ophidiomyces ophidiicola]
MSLDPRFYNSIAQLPPRPSLSHSSSNYPADYGGFTPSMASFTSASVAGVRSTASSPSLRAKERVAAPTTRPGTPVGSCTGGGNVKVVVRVRAFLQRELQRSVQCLIRMNPATQCTTLLAPNQDQNSKAQTRSKVTEDKTFTFDNSFWSHDEDDSHYATQEDVYNCLGEEFLDHNFEGYHTCIFAYGQTGSGKSYTMMGTPDNPGLIPRTLEDLFQRIENSESPDVTYHVRVSYFEVYNEHVRDLLVPRTDPPYYLKIRESPTDGPYVKDLTDVPVRNFEEVMRYMRKGDASRTTASTKMNDTSSRSHAVFTIMLKQIHHDLATDETIERTARIRLVDLAGSERAKATEATGQRLREGSNINKSLTTLGRVIAALADNKPGRGRKNRDIVPYRDSILTWLLKDSLGGNSKTAMIACIAPSDYEETLSTLRYADQAKRIRTRAVINQDHVSAAERDAQIAEMAETIRTLQLSVSQYTVSKRDMEMQNEKLEEYQKQVTKLQRLMEETKMVSENKIRQLQTENEALRLHLRLALDSLKNPIPPVEVAKRRTRNSSFTTATESQDTQSERCFEKENTAPQEQAESIWEDPFNDFDVEVQSEMEDLLSDLSFFRRKLADDCERFGVKRPCRGDRKMLSEVSVNI